MWQAFGLTPEEFQSRLGKANLGRSFEWGIIAEDLPDETLPPLASGRRVTAGAVVSATRSARDASTLVNYAHDWAAAD